jgi:hypothetical protein
MIFFLADAVEFRNDFNDQNTISNISDELGGDLRHI